MSAPHMLGAVAMAPAALLRTPLELSCDIALMPADLLAPLFPRKDSIATTHAAHAAAEPVTTILVDGIWSHRARMQFYRRRLAVAGPIEIFDYRCSGTVPIDELGAQLATRIRACSNSVNLVGFSMGGMVVRSAMQQDPSLRVRRVVFMCSPHKGSWPAVLLPWLPACRQLVPGSAFLQQLNEMPLRVPVLNIWCPGDLMVLPGWNARMADAADEQTCWVPAHMWPVFSTRLTCAVAEFLEGKE